MMMYMPGKRTRIQLAAGLFVEGTEFAGHEAIAKALNTQFFFTHPYCSWEKGLIENTNKLIRQYIPKKANLDNFNHQQIK
jgi:IS30 family transposase